MKEAASLDIPFVSGLVETLYDFYPAAVESIQRYTFDWRGIFCIREENGQGWVLRLLKHPDAAKDFQATAIVLHWLNTQGYPAPRVRQTHDRQLIGSKDNWTLLLLSFIEGEMIAPEPSDLRSLSARLGQLHVLNHHSARAVRLSRCHPQNILTHTFPQLRTGSRAASEAFAALFETLHDSMLAFLQMEHPRLAITHGDCWYMNAIKGDGCGVYLIDWDNVGMGAPILDLGYLLLSSHFRLEPPFVIEPDQESIQAIMEGYQQHYELSEQEIHGLLPAVQFLLAYQLGEYCKNNPSLQEDDLFLSKAQQRFNKAAGIAEMAEAYAERTRRK